MSDQSAVAHTVLLQTEKGPNPWILRKIQALSFAAMGGAWCLVLLWFFCMCAGLELCLASCLPLQNAFFVCTSRVSHVSQKGHAAWCPFCMTWVSLLQQGKTKLGKRKVHLLPLEGAGTSSSLLPQASYALASKPTLAHLCCGSCAALGLLSLLLKWESQVQLGAFANCWPFNRTCWLLPTAGLSCLKLKWMFLSEICRG